MIMNAKMNEALAFLSEKYSVPHGEIVMDGGRYKVITADGTATALLPWRVERRFFELRLWSVFLLCVLPLLLPEVP